MVDNHRIHDVLSLIKDGYGTSGFPSTLADRWNTSRSTADRHLRMMTKAKMIHSFGKTSARVYELKAKGEKVLYNLDMEHGVTTSSQVRQRDSRTTSSHDSRLPPTNAEVLAEVLQKWNRVWYLSRVTFRFPIYDRAAFADIQLLWDYEIPMRNWDQPKKGAHFIGATLEKTTKAFLVNVGELHGNNPAQTMLQAQEIAKSVITNLVTHWGRRLEKEIPVGIPSLGSNWEFETDDPDSRIVLDTFPGQVVVTEIEQDTRLRVERDRSKFGHDLVIKADDPDVALRYIELMDRHYLDSAKTDQLVRRLQTQTQDIKFQMDLMHRRISDNQLLLSSFVELETTKDRAIRQIPDDPSIN